MKKNIARKEAFRKEISGILNDIDKIIQENNFYESHNLTSDQVANSTE